jgi:quercetin dioxygenase-like cupin family protein
MFIRFQRSLGIRIFRFGKVQAELWLCPKGERLPAHRHAKMESRITFVAGRMLFTRDDRTIPLGLGQTLRTFKVAAGQAHSAIVTGLFGIFLNVESWTERPTSAAHDFIRI